MFTTDLIVKYCGGEMWQTMEPLVYIYEDVVYAVPAGHKTDFCSVPRLPFLYSWAGDTGEPAGTLHDWLYFSGIVPKEKADLMFYCALRDCGVPPFKASMMYQGVKLFGGVAWNHYRERETK